MAASRPGTFSHLAAPNPFAPFNPHDQHGNQSARASHRTSASDTQMDDGMNIPGSWGRGSAGNYTSQYGFGQSYGMGGNGGAASDDGFFIPSYLRHSQYIERLRAANEAKIAAQRDAPPHRPKGNGALSSRSSSASLPKLAPSHRGMTYEVIEHQPPEDNGGLTPLPAKWVETDKNQAIEIGSDGLDVRFVGGSKLHEHEAAAARTDHPMPVQVGLYYYEVTITSRGKDGFIGIGFSGPKVSLEKLPGWEPDSWGWHGDDGNTFCCQITGKKYGPTFTTGDVVGCGVNFMTGCAFFTKNGVFLGPAFRELKDVNVYPSIGMKRPHAQLTVNFGQRPFVFDIDGMMRHERSGIMEEISTTSISSLHTHRDETSFLKELVAQFLAHDGFVETARIFAQEVRDESRALQFGNHAFQDELSTEEDLDASNRQQIRSAIMEGDIDNALKRTRAFYPQVLQDLSHVYFRLRCQKFVEMIRQTAEFLDVSPSKPAKASNGHAPGSTDHEEMEVDDQKNEPEDWDKMETEEADSSVKYHELLEDTLRYGQELKQEFQDDPSTESTLKEIFSLFMYEDPRASPQAHLLDRASRVPVAEELNSAILVSLGKSSSAAIELLYQQTEVLVDYLSEAGGAGAFLHVRNDFLK
ncbi:MAG: hypothetical protein LQ348_006672 [Seirophora lacunosa]|nr:MAG: hypothetical protein LQ348_006672 [Seirophora lacunosa]